MTASRLKNPTVEDSSTTLEMPRFACIGHRGARGHAPENTLLGFETALRLGADWIELDVQRHGDQLLVFHDSRLERTTNGSGRLADADWSVIRELDAGRGERIPTLDEVIELIAGRAGINIEIKSANGTADVLAPCLQRQLQRGTLKPNQLLVSSFLHTELFRFKQLMPRCPIGVLICGVPRSLAAQATELGASSVHLEADFLTPDMLRDARKRGLKVLVYTVNARTEIDELRAMGIDGVFTDYPERASYSLAAA